MGGLLYSNSSSIQTLHQFKTIPYANTHIGSISYMRLYLVYAVYKAVIISPLTILRATSVTHVVLEPPTTKPKQMDQRNQDPIKLWNKGMTR